MVGRLRAGDKRLPLSALWRTESTAVGYRSVTGVPVIVVSPDLVNTAA